MLTLITATNNSMSTLADSLASADSIRSRVKTFFIDGGSTDGTAEFLKSYVAENDNAEFLSQKDNGLYQALNQGIRQAILDPTTTHIGMLHSDDRLISANYVEYLNCIESGDADIYYSDIGFHDATDQTVRVWKSGEYSKFKLHTGWMPPHTSMIVSKSIYSDLGLYDPAFGTAADYEWIVRVLRARPGGVMYFPKRTVSMLAGGASNENFKARLRANAMDGRVWAGHSVLQAALIRALKPARKVGQFFVTTENK